MVSHETRCFNDISFKNIFWVFFFNLCIKYLFLEEIKIDGQLKLYLQANCAFYVFVL